MVSISERNEKGHKIISENGLEDVLVGGDAHVANGNNGDGRVVENGANGHHGGNGKNGHQKKSVVFFPPDFIPGSTKSRVEMINGSNNGTNGHCGDTENGSQNGNGSLTESDGVVIEKAVKPKTYWVADWYSDNTVEVSEEQYEKNKYRYIRVEDDDGNDLPLAKKEARVRNDVVDVILPVAALLPEGVKVRVGEVSVVKKVIDESAGVYCCVATADKNGEEKKLARVMRGPGGNDLSVHDGNFPNQDERVRLLSDVANEAWKVDDDDNVRQRVAVGALNKTLELMLERKTRDPNEIGAGDVVHVLYSNEDVVVQKPPFVILAGAPMEPVIRLFRTNLSSNDDGVLVSVEVTIVDFDVNTHQVKNEGKYVVREWGVEEAPEEDGIHHPAELMSELLSKMDIKGEISADDYDTAMDRIKRKTDEINQINEKKQHEEMKQAEEAEKKRITEEMEAVESKKAQNKEAMAKKMADSVMSMAEDMGLSNIRELSLNDSLPQRMVRVLSVEEYDGDNWEKDIKILSVELLDSRQKLVNGKPSKWVGETGLVDRVVMRQNEKGEWETFFAKGDREVKLTRVQRLNILMDVVGVRGLDESNPITGNVSETTDESGKKTWKAVIEVAQGDMEIVRVEEGGKSEFKVILGGKETQIESSDWFYPMVDRMYGVMTGGLVFDFDMNLQPKGFKGKKFPSFNQIRDMSVGGNWINESYQDMVVWGVLADVINDSTNGEIDPPALPILEMASKFLQTINRRNLQAREVVAGLVSTLRTVAGGRTSGGYFEINEIRLGNLKQFDAIVLPVNAGGEVFMYEIGGENGMSVYKNEKQPDETRSVKGTKYNAFQRFFGYVDEPDRSELVPGEVVRKPLHPVMERLFIANIQKTVQTNEFDPMRKAVIREFYNAKTPGVYSWFELADFTAKVGKVSKPSKTSSNSPLNDFQPEDENLAKQRYVVIGLDGELYILRHLSQLNNNQKMALFPDSYRFSVPNSERPPAPDDAWVLEYPAVAEREVVHPTRVRLRQGVEVKQLKGRFVPSIDMAINMIQVTNMPVVVSQPGGLPKGLDLVAISRIAESRVGSGVVLWEQEAKADWSGIGQYATTAKSTRKEHVRVPDSWENGVRGILAKSGLTDDSNVTLFKIAEEWSRVSEAEARQVVESLLVRNSANAHILRPIFNQMMEHVHPKKTDKVSKKVSPVSKKAKTATVPAAKDEDETEDEVAETIDDGMNIDNVTWDDIKVNLQEQGITDPNEASHLMIVLGMLKKGASREEILKNHGANPRIAEALNRLQEWYPAESETDEVASTATVSGSIGGVNEGGLGSRLEVIRSQYPEIPFKPGDVADIFSSNPSSIDVTINAIVAKISETHPKMENRLREALDKIKEAVLKDLKEKAFEEDMDTSGVADNRRRNWEDDLDNLDDDDSDEEVVENEWSHITYNDLMAHAAYEGVNDRVQGRLGEILDSFQDGENFFTLLNENSSDKDYIAALRLLRDWNESGVFSQTDDEDILARLAKAKATNKQIGQ